MVRHRGQRGARVASPGPGDGCRCGERTGAAPGGPGTMTPGYQLGLHAQLACIWEATARKPGNVHRFRDFEGTTYLDFIQSAVAIAPVLERASEQRVGETILQCVRATQAITRTNTNLGIILLLTPLATV